MAAAYSNGARPTNSLTHNEADKFRIPRSQDFGPQFGGGDDQVQAVRSRDGRQRQGNHGVIGDGDALRRDSTFALPLSFMVA